MKLFGLTGGIACGKSFVTSVFEELGALVIDADDVYHTLIDSKDLTASISETFGSEYADTNGLIDRKKLGKLVFSDKSALKKLNSITHPVVLKKIKSLIKDARNQDTHKLCILSVPLLYEIGLEGEVEKVIVVYTDESVQLERLCSRSSLPKDEALRRIHSQMSLQEKVERADIVIDNNGEKEKTRKAVQDLFGRLSDF